METSGWFGEEDSYNNSVLLLGYKNDTARSRAVLCVQTGGCVHMEVQSNL